MELKIGKVIKALARTRDHLVCMANGAIKVAQGDGDAVVFAENVIHMIGEIVKDLSDLGLWPEGAERPRGWEDPTQAVEMRDVDLCPELLEIARDAAEAVGNFYGEEYWEERMERAKQWTREKEAERKAKAPTLPKEEESGMKVLTGSIWGYVEKGASTIMTPQQWNQCKRPDKAQLKKSGKVQVVPTTEWVETVLAVSKQSYVVVAIPEANRNIADAFRSRSTVGVIFYGATSVQGEPTKVPAAKKPETVLFQVLGVRRGKEEETMFLAVSEADAQARAEKAGFSEVLAVQVKEAAAQ